MNMYVTCDIHVHIEMCIKVGSIKISYTMMHGRKNIKLINAEQAKPEDNVTYMFILKCALKLVL